MLLYYTDYIYIPEEVTEQTTEEVNLKSLKINKTVCNNKTKIFSTCFMSRQPKMY